MIYDKLGLAMIPSGYKGESDENNAGGFLGKVYSVLPAQTTSDNLVTNGTFDTDSDWSKGTGWSIANGVAESDGSVGFLTQIGIVDLKVSTYKLTYTVKTSNNNIFRLSGGSSAFPNTIIPSTVGTHTVTVKSNGTQNRLQIYNSNGWIGTIDDT